LGDDEAVEMLNVEQMCDVKTWFETQIGLHLMVLIHCVAEHIIQALDLPCFRLTRMASILPLIPNHLPSYPPPPT